MRFRVLLELPILCSLITAALTIGAHTIGWKEIGGSRGKDRRQEFASGQLTGTHLIANYCSGCHHAGRSGIDFDDELLTLDVMRSDPVVWRQVVEKLRSHAMPPRSFPQPTTQEREFLMAWIEEEVLDERHFAKYGRFMVRRLQRSEYLNSVRDLLGILPSFEMELPKDETVWRRCNQVPDASEHREQYYRAAKTLLDQAMAAEFDRYSLDGLQDIHDWHASQDQPIFSSACSCGASAELARGILDDFVRRAFRKQVEPSEIDRFVEFFKQAESDGQSFPDSMKHTLAELLTSPHFLYRVEFRNAELAKPGEEFALATRLSYFLWRSTPDDELLAQAEQGLLSRNLDVQVQRMLMDWRARAFVTDFSDHWLSLVKLNQMQHLDENLRQAMRQETEHFVAHLLWDDRSVLEFLASDYTFLNERLATHYGISGVRGQNMRRVAITGTQRGGLLGHASILTVTSPNVATSPVNRGKWVMENLLGAPPIKPPPGLIQSLQTGPAKTQAGSLRKNLEAHRNNPSCAECHVKLDSIGIALENFDTSGQWRQANGQQIDSGAALPDDEFPRNYEELKAYLLTHRASFMRGLHEKLLQFALGRKIDDRDRAAFAFIPHEDAEEHYRFSRVILNVVQSTPFQQGWCDTSRIQP